MSSSNTTADYVQNFARDNGIKLCEAIARIAGFSCYEQYRQAKFVVAHGIPELVEAMNSGKVALHNAAFIARWAEDIQIDLLTHDSKTIRQLVRILKRAPLAELANGQKGQP